MLAAFIALIWLVPFNSLELERLLPDRPVARPDRASGRRASPGRWRWLRTATSVPRLRLTWIHVALGVFLVVALLSVVLDARYLNQTLELDLSLKKLPLLLSYVTCS